MKRRGNYINIVKIIEKETFVRSIAELILSSRRIGLSSLDGGGLISYVAHDEAQASVMISLYTCYSKSTATATIALQLIKQSRIEEHSMGKTLGFRNVLPELEHHRCLDKNTVAHNDATITNY